MVMVQSAMMELGTAAPDFTLTDTVSGREMNLSELRGEKGILIMFICNHCPFVVHIQKGLSALGKDYHDSGIGIAAISANDVADYPEDSPDKMKAAAKREGFVFPYLYDETQETARAYGAECTPDFFLFDGDLKCVYRGRFDGSRPGNPKPVTGADIRDAMDLLIAGKSVPAKSQLPSIGCNIKWKS